MFNRKFIMSLGFSQSRLLVLLSSRVHCLFFSFFCVLYLSSLNIHVYIINIIVFCYVISIVLISNYLISFACFPPFVSRSEPANFTFRLALFHFPSQTKMKKGKWKKKMKKTDKIKQDMCLNCFTDSSCRRHLHCTK